MFEQYKQELVADEKVRYFVKICKKNEVFRDGTCARWLAAKM